MLVYASTELRQRSGLHSALTLRQNESLLDPNVIRSNVFPTVRSTL